MDAAHKPVVQRAEVNGEFHSVVVRVESLGPGGPADLHLGYLIYGWLSQQVLAAETASAAQLHGSRALAVSPLLAESSAALADRIAKGNRYAFRVSFLEARGYEAWRERIWPLARGRELRVGAQAFRAVDETEDSTVHPLAGHATVGELIRFGEQHAGEALALQFLTPTAFKSTYWPAAPEGQPACKPIDVEVPLPDPARIMASLAGRWQRFALPATTIPAELVEMARQTTALSRCAVHTEAGRTKGEVRGFVGSVELRSLAPLHEARALVAMLCRFSEFAGIGNKTAHGMGLARLLPI